MADNNNDSIGVSSRENFVFPKFTAENIDIKKDIISNIKPNSISKLEKLMRQNDCDIGTLASFIKNADEIIDANMVKVLVDQELENDSFSNAKDFFRIKTALLAPLGGGDEIRVPHHQILRPAYLLSLCLN